MLTTTGQERVFTQVPVYVLVCCRKELDALRSELSAAHAQSLRQALATLTAEKNSELSGARHRWEREQSSLKEKVNLFPL